MRRALLLACWIAVACAAGSPAGESRQPAHRPHAPVHDASPPIVPAPSASREDRIGGSPSASALPTASALAVTPATPCPAEMVLIAAGRCDDPEQTCRENWYDSVLKKKVCVRYDSPARCRSTPAPRRFCIDRLEAPGKPGALPDTGRDPYGAELVCARRGARLCTVSEWQLACEGDALSPFPYGFERRARRCGGDLAPGTPEPRVAVDALPECASSSGVAALAGNAAELVALDAAAGPEEARGASSSSGDDEFRVAGSAPFKGERNECRSLDAPSGVPSQVVGYRCCAEADGQPTDPRTPAQRARGWSIERIERIARGRAPAVAPR